jgi:DNA-binding SARP family transcriptional activator
LRLTEGLRGGDSAIRLRLLGSPELSGVVEPRGHSLLAQPKSLGVLAYVALAPPPGYRRRDAMAALFWPEQDQSHARGALRRVLHLLRDALGEQAITRRGNEDIAVASELVTTDAAAFDEACAAGHWEAALDLYRGDLLEGFYLPGVAPQFEHWLDQERVALRKRARRAAEQLSESALAAGNLSSSAEYAARAVSLFPDDEPQLRRLLRVLAELGDGAGANRAYHAFARRLATEYDVAPAPETQALIAGIRSRSVPRARTSAKLLRQPAVPPAADPPAAMPPVPTTLPSSPVARARWGFAAWLGLGLLAFALALTTLGR